MSGGSHDEGMEDINRVQSKLRLDGGILFLDVGLDGTFIQTVVVYKGTEETAKAIFYGDKKLTPDSKLALEAQYSKNP